jgi:hypothetical protein
MSLQKTIVLRTIIGERVNFLPRAGTYDQVVFEPLASILLSYRQHG